jgi:alpha-1,3-rhamnosyl/mannosyltransferase
MQVAIDATTLLLPSAGVKNYIYYWLQALMTAAPARGDSLMNYPLHLKPSEVLNHKAYVSGSAFGSFLRRQFVRLANTRGNPLLDLALREADLFHSSQHTARLPRRITTTATIFDFSCWTKPDTHTKANITATKRYAANILKQCDALIAISDHARRDAIAILDIPPDRIRVIYPGVAEAFFEVTEKEELAVRAAYKLPSSYLLFVGCIEPRKNIRGLIRAYNGLPAGLRRNVPLLIAGPFGWEDNELRTSLSQENIRYLGYVPEARLPGLFRGAAAFVYPSYYEGFGLPVAQAMATGVPVVTSNCSSLPEVVGKGGLTVDPYDAENILEAMYRILSCQSLAQELASQGRHRARNYRWADVAAASLDFFHDVAA